MIFAVTAPVLQKRTDPVVWSLALLICVLATALVLVFGVIYYWAGWHRMADSCRPHGRSTEVSYSWSWTAPGFTCTSGDGHRESKLWW
jgi:hypothetical protein